MSIPSTIAKFSLSGATPNVFTISVLSRGVTIPSASEMEVMVCSGFVDGSGTMQSSAKRRSQKAFITRKVKDVLVRQEAIKTKDLKKEIQDSFNVEIETVAVRKAVFEAKKRGSMKRRHSKNSQASFKR